jgi:UDP-N-acetyl-D-galactosamine dehydrogenase
VQVLDPHASTEEAEHEYGIVLTERDSARPAAAVILAVPHKEYLQLGWSGMQAFLEHGRGPVLDVKAKLPREAVPAGVELWRL